MARGGGDVEDWEPNEKSAGKVAKISVTVSRTVTDKFTRGVGSEQVSLRKTVFTINTENQFYARILSKS